MNKLEELLKKIAPSFLSWIIRPGTLVQ
uniref:Uncharacterized protein n=1 Tax=Anguilla anguilla TaxID=7936 RepID=A0A0E9PRK6_ANGAN